MGETCPEVEPTARDRRMTGEETSPQGGITMRVIRFVSLVMLLVLPLTMVSPAAADHEREWKRRKVRFHDRGELFCPSATLLFDDVIIERGRCFVLSVLREPHGTFLAFVAPGAGIPAGQLILTSPGGFRLRQRILFLVPIRTQVVLVPVNTITFVPVRVEDFGPRLAIVLIGARHPGVTVVFNVRL